MVKKIIIMGGGIGGLSAAHELAKNKEFDITLVERSTFLGGQAAEIIDKSKNHTALCWHAVSSYYKYFLGIMDEITDHNGVKVISHLKPLDKFIYGLNDSNVIEYTNSFITVDFTKFADGFKKIYKKSPPSKDMIKLLFIYHYAQIICEERLETYDKILWKDYIDGLSQDVKRWVLDSTSIYLGMDYSKLSTYFVFNLIRKEIIPHATKLDDVNVFYSFDGSMVDTLYIPWKEYLEERGVKFLLNHEITNIYHTAGLTTIASVDILNKKNNIHNVHTADIFVNAMDTKNLAQLYPIKDVAGLTKFAELHENSEQVQTQVLYYLPYKLQPIGTKPTILILPDSQWFLMVRIEGDIWDLTHNDLLSCGIGMWDVPGSNGKCAVNCTREELAAECWVQINAAKHNLKLSDVMPQWNIWDSFQFDFETGKMSTHEPKFSNNINTLELRPNYSDDKISNLYHAVSYARTITDTYNMESAAESGVKAARSILAKETQSTYIEPKAKSKKWWINLIRNLDKFLFKFI